MRSLSAAAPAGARCSRTPLTPAFWAAARGWTASAIFSAEPVAFAALSGCLPGTRASFTASPPTVTDALPAVDTWAVALPAVGQTALPSRSRVCVTAGAALSLGALDVPGLSTPTLSILASGRSSSFLRPAVDCAWAVKS